MAEEIIIQKAIAFVATCMLYTGHAYPLVNEADIRCALHYTAMCAACVIACPYRDNAAWRLKRVAQKLRVVLGLLASFCTPQ